METPKFVFPLLDQSPDGKPANPNAAWLAGEGVPLAQDTLSSLTPEQQARYKNAIDAGSTAVSGADIHPPTPYSPS